MVRDRAELFFAPMGADLLKDATTRLPVADGVWRA